ncbi:MAG: enoyl-CoA hydratase/isomerase family protein [Firmicutes bacterium]|nr:enoyl-CoA hydratase/isomerase family protein [Bacillota bacterium]
MNPNIIFKKENYRAYIILDKPEKLNALDMDMYREIGQLLKQVNRDPEVRVVIIKGNGKAFSSGFDIADEVDCGIMEEKADIEDVCNQNRWDIWNLSKPVIAQVQGYCLAGALELVLPCDYIIAADDAKMGLTAIKFGVVASYLMMPWLVGIRKSKELLLTGERISGKEAAECGLITKSVPLEDLESTVEEIAEKLIRISPPAMNLQKIQINRTFEIMGMKAAIDSAADLCVFARAVQTDEVREFNKIVDEQGVKAALKWQDEYFKR